MFSINIQIALAVKVRNTELSIYVMAVEHLVPCASVIIGQE